MSEKIFSSALSTQKDWQKAVKELATKVSKDLDGKPCDLLVFFVSEAFDNFDAEAFTAELGAAIPSTDFIGCNSSGVIGNKSEVEMEPAISVLAMHLPDVKLASFYIPAEDASNFANGNELINFLDIFPTDKPHFICLADPMTTDIMKLLNAFNDGYKGLPIVGGLASGGVVGAPNWICLDKKVYKEGAVGVALTGNIEYEVIVSQGCRPIGQPLVVTKAEDNVLYELAGRPALQVVKELLEGLPSKDRTLAEQSLSVGLVMNEKQNAFKRGDFLIRNLMGFDPDSGALVIGAHLKIGQTMQFQLRDAATSSEDLQILLEKSHPLPSGPKGGILVSCCGRGKNFYGAPHHDAIAIQTAKGPLPLTGFFANGEIGPVGSKNYVHGYTSSLIILH
jgi:small ligand-binding sensory domain FIST